MRESGALLGNQARALEAVIDYGPATSGEIIARGIGVAANVNLWRARFTELAGRGLIREIGQRACTITGRTALVWEFTGRAKPLDLTRGRKITAIQRKRVLAVLTDRIEGFRVEGSDLWPEKVGLEELRAFVDALIDAAR
jgi:hypothetical protein